jgi:hypothetical protein
LAFDGDSTMTRRVVLVLLGTALPHFYFTLQTDVQRNAPDRRAFPGHRATAW